MLSGDEVGKAVTGCFTVVIVVFILGLVGAAAVGVWVGTHIDHDPKHAIQSQ